MNQGCVWRIVPMGMVLSVTLLCGCSLVAQKDTKALFYENSPVMKVYEREKEEVVNPDIESDVGYCPVCEL